jgi:hypothetical protein
MGTLSIVQLLAILLLPLILIGIAFRAWQSSKRGPTGFGGWLLVLAIGQTGAPFGKLSGLLGDLTSGETFRKIPNGELVNDIETALDACFLILLIVATDAMYAKKRLFRPLFLCQWLAGVTLFVVQVATFAKLLPLPFGKQYIITFSGPLVILVVVGFWVWYVFSSKRVAGTFVN